MKLILKDGSEIKVTRLWPVGSPVELFRYINGTATVHEVHISELRFVQFIDDAVEPFRIKNGRGA